MVDRSEDLARIADRLASDCRHSSQRCIVGGGDSLELMRRIPDSSISLILTDPPYHTTQKANIYGDTAFKADQHYLDWMQQYAKEWQRILRPNGGVYMFCSTPMSARLEVMISEFLRPLNHITWTKPNDPGFDGWKGKMQKEALRAWYAHSERILFFEQAAANHDRRSTLAAYLRATRIAAGISGHALTELVGAYGAVNHGGAVSNWETGRNVPSQEQYERITEAILATGQVEEMLPYEDVVRPFNVSAKVEFTDVWTFPSVRPYRGKHPAEKPLEMLQHAIRSSTYEGDIVLDCFAGSGSTAVAALTTNRRSVALEIEPNWVNQICERVAEAELTVPATSITDLRVRRLTPKAPSLFDAVSL